MTSDQFTKLRELAGSLPYPVACGVGRIARASSDAEEFDAIVRAAEALSRYLAVLATASLAARENRDATLWKPDGSLAKHLAWGDFLNIARRVASVEVEHPLKRLLTQGLGLKKSQRDGQGRTSALDHLEELSRSRNATIGHSLAVRHAASARAALERASPEGEAPLGRLLESIDQLMPILRLPLIVVERQRQERGVRYARVLPYIGETDPFPTEMPLRELVDEDEPMVIFGKRALPLAPGLISDVHQAMQQTTLLFIDAIKDSEVTYRALRHDAVATRPIDAMHPLEWFNASPVAAREFVDLDGNSRESWLRECARPGGSNAIPGAPSPPAPATSSPPIVEAPPPEASPPRQSTPEKVPADSEVRAPAESISSSDAPFQRRSVEEITAIASSLGLAPQFTAILEATESCGLFNRPYRHGVMSTPQEHKNRYLVWSKLVSGKKPILEVSVQADAFEEFFEVSAERVRSLIGAPHRFAPGDPVEDLLAKFRTLRGELRRPRSG